MFDHWTIVRVETAMGMAAGLAILVWIALLTGRGGFWRASERLPTAFPSRESEVWPGVAVLIPARDEAASIAKVLESHRASAYPGRMTVILIDDGSADGTAELAEAIAARPGHPIHVIEAPEPAPGWTGKLWALETGRGALTELAPAAELVLLTDADIVHDPHTLTRLVEHLRNEDCEMVSLMARLDARGFWGGLLIPAFVFFFQKLYPFPWVNDPSRSTAAAAGGCVLVRRAALDGIGGLGAIRAALIDDCALADAIKGQDGHIWLGLAGDEAVSLRDNRSFGSIWCMVARTAYTQLRHSPIQLAGAVAGMVLVYLAGPSAVLTFPWHHSQGAAALGAVAWMLSGLAYLPTLRLYAKPAWQALGLPLAALLYTAMTVGSAVDHWRGRGGQWKGRSY